MPEKASVLIPDLIELAMDQFKNAAESEYQIRADCLDDLKFSTTGGQWDLAMLTARQQRGKPSLTMDQTQQSIRLVCNQYRQQPPSIKVDPIGNGADQETADIIQGTFRHIENQSYAAALVYEPTHEGVVRKGFSSWRILNEYVDDETEDQEIYLEKIRNDFSVYWQPGVTHEKAKWCFIVEDIPTERYQDEHKESEMAKLGADFTAIGNAPPDWANQKSRRVAEYFTVEEVKREGKRPIKKVMWRKINCMEVLEGPEELPGTTIPVFTAYGDDLDVDGKRYIAGLLRNAKDPQRMVNYWASKATEACALNTASPIAMVAGQDKDFEQEWEQANSGNLMVLHYHQVDNGGKPAPAPYRIAAEPAIQGYQSMLMEAKMDVKAAMGIYDPSLGQRKGNESGVAVERLQQQGSLATINFADNVGHEMRRCGKLLLEWVKVFYGPARIQRIVNPDGSITQVAIHVGEGNKAQAQQLAEKEGINKIYDIGTGRYDVGFSVGKNYQSKRQEAVETQLELMKVLPKEIAPLIADLVTRNMDIPQNDEIADRLKKMLPPQLQDGDENDPEVRLQKAESLLQQLGQQHQMLTQQLTEATKIIETKQVEQQGKMEVTKIQEQSRQTIEQMKIEAQIAIAEIDAKVQDLQQRRQWEQDVWKETHGSAHEAAMQAQDQAHQKELADQAAQQDQQSQAADQQHEQSMAEQQAEQVPQGA